ncbi:hypothetical protein DACRYDRAFT_105115 [Dacryopinax primogenitus]|uniref:BSD domain-containing protein n=1 Tax=Dacryopinax primogenitus (strain DJM 731) TaxID=1858805 RepID=M5G769_DACPD|nr:uncharacterized protein DACRYDRAFT_105115 [Dacryopinax primogenitus]EJU04050.1 hypothetical protein DACRYDRAFT_105115 [Dacryopinax primogenitus]
MATKQQASGPAQKKWLTRAPAVYNKLPGTLFLGPERLVWKQEGVPQPAVNVKLDKASAMFNSKEGALPVRLKLTFTDNEKGFQFAFSSPEPSTALEHRTSFVNHLTPLINRNKAALLGSPGPGTPGTPGSGDGPGTPVPGVPAGSTAQIGEENQLRRSVLLKHPPLAALHRQLVLSGQLTETDFWQGRSSLLLAERASQEQKRGRASTLVDPKPQTAEGGDIKIVVTPQLVHEIFEEFPVVGRAYAENVPGEMSESAFWQRYFQSALFHQNRASTRSSAPQTQIKPDPIFDRYLVPEDDQPSPISRSAGGALEEVDRLLDLAATEEDHEQGGNQKDVTMRPGRERGILPLIRRFNNHSERLVKASLGEDGRDAAEEGGDRKRRRLEGGEVGRFNPNDYYDEIVISDLIDQHASSGVQLDMLNASLFSTSAPSATRASLPQRTPAESTALLHTFQQETKDYLPSLHSLKPNRRAGEHALQSMTSTVRAAHVAHRSLPPIPPEFLRGMTTCQTAANEFLRQFWGAVLPPPSLYPAYGGQDVGGGRVLGMSGRERAQKAGKMAGFLAGTGEKVDALVRQAEGEGVDPERVRAAFAPLMFAVDKALKVYSQRRKKAT